VARHKGLGQTQPLEDSGVKEIQSILIPHLVSSLSESNKVKVGKIEKRLIL
jgi:hypothetical protein